MSVNTLRGPIPSEASALRRTLDRAREDPAYQAFALLRIGFTSAPIDMRVPVGPQPRPRDSGSRSCSRSTISIRVAQAHPTCHDASRTRASASPPGMDSPPRLIFSVDPID